MHTIDKDPALMVVKMAGRVMSAADVSRLTSALPQWRISAYANVDAIETYVYVQPMPVAIAAHTAWAEPIVHMHSAFGEANTSIVLLTEVQDLAGASSGRDAPWHYVVETDVVPDHDAALNDWYNREHLPGLASVPGTVRARRFACKEGGPRYHACYDLETRETFGSPPWLAVRATDWSSQVRPAFRNTKRTMFKRID